MEIDDSDFLIVRKNLNVLSVIILILAFTNAKVEMMSLFGISLTLNGEKLYTALFIIYLYFVWRYFTKLPLLSGFWHGFLQFYLESEAGVKKQHTFERHRTSFIKKKPILQKLSESDPQFRLLDLRVSRFSGKSLMELRLSAHFYVSKSDSVNNIIGNNLTVDFDFTVSRIFLIGKILVYSLKHDKFGDYLFPIIPMLVNMCFFLFSPSWQGGMRNLILERI